MSDTTITNLPSTASESEMDAGSFIAMDVGSTETKKLPAQFVARASDIQTLLDDIATKFVPNSTTTVEGWPYIYNGSLYVAKEVYQGPWDSGKFTSATVADLFGFLKSYYEKPTTTFGDNYFVNYSTGAVQAVAGISASAAINVRFASEIELVAYGGASVDARGCAFYDEDGNFVSGMQYAANKNTLSLTVPSNAVTFRFSTESDKKSVTEFRFVDVFGCLQRVADFAVEVVGEKWLAYKPTLSSNWTDNYFVNGNNGKITSLVGNFSVLKIDVRGFKSITFLADHTVNAGDARGYAFYDEDGTTISSAVYAIGTGTYPVQNLTVPSNAYTFAFTGTTANKSNYYLKLRGTNDAVVKLLSEVARLPAVEDIKNSLVAVRPTLDWVDDYFVSGVTGIPVAYSDTSIVFLNVRGFKSVKFLADYIVLADSRGYAFYDVDGAVISYSKYNVGSGRYVANVSVPSNACYFAFTATKASKTDYYAELHGTDEAVMATSEAVAKMQTGVTLVPFSMFSNFASCGDSFTAGSIFNSASVYLGDFPKVSWGKVLERLTGVENFIYASGGATTKTFRTRAECLPKILTDPARDLYIIALGINDYGTVNIGTLSDINDIDPELNADTYYGNYGYIIAKIKDHAPNAKIILLKSWLPKYTAVNPYGRSGYYSYMSTAIEELADHFGCLFVETLYIPFLCSPEYNEGFYGGHPTAPLYAGMAYAMRKAISEVLTQNIGYLNDYTPS